MKKHVLVTSALLSLLFLSTQAAAMAGFNSWLNSQHGYLAAEIARSKTTQSTETIAAMPPVQLQINTAYQPIPSITQKVKKLFIDDRENYSMHPGLPADSVQRLNPETTFNSMVGQYGLQSNDVADAMAAYWLTQWTIVHNRQMPNRSAVLGVRNQMQNVLALTEYDKKPNTEKQLHAQMMILMTVELMAWKQNQSSQNQIRQGVEYNAQRNGLNLTKLIATDKGFQLAR